MTSDPARLSAASGVSVTHCALVLTSAAELPRGVELERAVRDLAGGAVGWEASGGRGVLTVDGLRVEVVAQAAPAPSAEADTAAFLSLSSLRGNWRLPPHAAHLTVRRLDGEVLTRPSGLLGRVLGSPRPASPLEALTRFTRAVAAVTAASNAVGVYWGAGPVTHEPRFFVDLAKQTEVPLPLWLGVTITPEPGDRLCILSMGMGQLALPDLLLGAPRAELGDTLDFFFSTLAFVAERGAPLPEGHVVPRSLLQRPSVRYVASPLDDKTRVFRLDLP